MSDTTLGVVCGEDVRSRFAFSLLDLVQARPRIGPRVITIGGPALVRLRNDNARGFLQTASEFYLCIDSDIVFLPTHVDSLYEADGDVAAAWYPDSRGEQTFGAGFMLVRRRVIEAFDGGWFDLLPREPTESDPETQLGEDLSFFRRVAERGFDVKLLPSLRVSHAKVITL